MNFQKIIEYVRKMEKYGFYLTTSEVILNIFIWEENNERTFLYIK